MAEYALNINGKKIQAGSGTRYPDAVGNPRYGWPERYQIRLRHGTLRSLYYSCETDIPAATRSTTIHSSSIRKNDLINYYRRNLGKNLDHIVSSRPG
jgi:hypothetical protein